MIDPGNFVSCRSYAAKIRPRIGPWTFSQVSNVLLSIVLVCENTLEVELGPLGF